MAPDGLVLLVIDGRGFKDALHLPEKLLRELLVQAAFFKISRYILRSLLSFRRPVNPCIIGRSKSTLEFWRIIPDRVKHIIQSSTNGGIPVSFPPLICQTDDIAGRKIITFKLVANFSNTICYILRALPRKLKYHRADIFEN